MRVRCRMRSRYLSKSVITKRKMESNVLRRSKRKSPCVNAIFELNDGDVSPEPDEIDSLEPQAKIQKTDGESPKTQEVKIVENSNNNLESTDTQNNVEVEVKPQKSSEIIQQVIVEEITETTTIEVAVEKPLDSLETISDIKGGEKPLEDGEVSETADTTQNSEAELCVPCLSIRFHDDSVCKAYKQKFVKFLESFIELKIETSSDDLTINVTKDVTFDPSEWMVVDETLCLTEEVLPIPIEEEEEVLAKELPQTPELVTPNAKKKKKKRTKKERELFILDSTPTLETSQHSVQTKYSSKFLIEDIQDDDIDKRKEGLKPVGQMCFNCGSNHSLKDCPEPKVMGRINANRQKFNMNKNKSLRYHLEEDQKYHHLIPGKISETLREALGLRKNQLPSYIYQMRLLGYPPGWLEQAKLVHSNLAMYDVDGNNVKETKNSITQGLDEEKVVDYPGFNVPLEKGFKDEFKQHGTPPYSQQYNKAKMIEFFKRECLKEVDNLETCDMDLDTTNELNELEKEEVIVETEIVKTKVVENTPIKILKTLGETHSDIPSPSLNDLEKVKETLLAALNDDKEVKESSDNSNIEKIDEPNSEEEAASEPEQQINDEETIEDCENMMEDTSKDGENDEKTECDVATSSRISPTPSNSSESIDNVATIRNTVKTSSAGTPILKSHSPYARLPNPDNFSKDVSPVINFENLPNSTGKYDQMTGVLQKVRNTLKSLQPKCK